ncbi:hypothetical protein Hanom_Chr06g00545321 [Helianthus anomalus]
MPALFIYNRYMCPPSTIPVHHLISRFVAVACFCRCSLLSERYRIYPTLTTSLQNFQGDSDEKSLGDDEPLFPPFVESSSNKRKKSKDVFHKHSSKSKTSSFE